MGHLIASVHLSADGLEIWNRPALPLQGKLEANTQSEFALSL